MDFDFTEEQILVRDTARDFAIRELDPIAAQQVAQDLGRTLRGTWRADIELLVARASQLDRSSHPAGLPDDSAVGQAAHVGSGSGLVVGRIATLPILRPGRTTRRQESR